MATRKTLGELEHLLMLSILRLGEAAYGVTMRREIEERTGRPVSLGSIYPTLDRLEEKGYVSSAMSEPTKERGGRSRRYFRLEQDGREALEQAHAVFTAMWEGLEPDKGMGR